MPNIPTLKELRVSRGIPAREIVELVRTKYPKFDAPSLSRAERSEYGAKLPDDALNLIYATFAPELVPLLHRKERDRHKLTCRALVRMPSDVYDLLTQRVKDDGHNTVQGWLLNLIRVTVAAPPENQTYFFTFGSEGHPFVGGWTEIGAPSEAAAISLFRAIHQDETPGIINCSRIYNERYFKTTSMYRDGNLGHRCHERYDVYRRETSDGNR